MKEFVVEYKVSYNLRFKNKEKNCNTLYEIKEYGSSISFMELSMILDDILKDFNFSQKDMKISYNINKRDNELYLYIAFTLEKRQNKEELKKLFLVELNEYLEDRRVHIFIKNNIEYELFCRVV